MNFKLSQTARERAVETAVPSLIPVGVGVEFGIGWALVTAGVVWSALGVLRALVGDS